LRHTRLQQESPKAVLVTRSDIRQAQDSNYHYSGLDLGGGLVRHDINVELRDSGAECRLHGACLARGRAHVDNHMDVEHTGPGCKSDQLFRGVLGDRSRAVFNSRVYVAAGADGTEARQSSAGLLLSPHAEIDAKPELEIHADEVIASHGATVGQLDEDALFYLRSRGMDMATARNLLTMAFCRSVVEQLPSEALRKALGARLEAGLQAGGVA
jgi:Fe-S cluster assembly protein SufD